MLNQNVANGIVKTIKPLGITESKEEEEEIEETRKGDEFEDNLWMGAGRMLITM